eukprot:TRINITY_DN9996_c0_g2_i1.p1 TRINITY_DN9996_c0_g2~~TRINITY_DN9996_c0_g2_i1.p1  ORF type:complete len:354 (+),score=50.31 TRINITY_DN9996_c0_g2_i1:38-1063(+)
MDSFVDWRLVFRERFLAELPWDDRTEFCDHSIEIGTDCSIALEGEYIVSVSSAGCCIFHIADCERVEVPAAPSAITPSFVTKCGDLCAYRGDAGVVVVSCKAARVLSTIKLPVTGSALHINAKLVLCVQRTDLQLWDPFKPALVRYSALPSPVESSCFHDSQGVVCCQTDTVVVRLVDSRIHLQVLGISALICACSDDYFAIANIDCVELRSFEQPTVVTFSSKHNLQCPLQVSNQYLYFVNFLADVVFYDIAAKMVGSLQLTSEQRVMHTDGYRFVVTGLPVRDLCIYTADVQELLKVLNVDDEAVQVLIDYRGCAVVMKGHGARWFEYVPRGSWRRMRQ